MPLSRLSPIVLATACGAGTPPLEPPATIEANEARRLTASEHVAIAEQHARRAASLARWLDAQGGPEIPFEAGGDLWYRAWQTLREEEHETQTHLAVAADLRATYERACRGRRKIEIETTAIERHGLTAIPTHDGAIVMLAPQAGPAERLVTDLRCHRAWMMLGDQQPSMKRCALDLTGLDVVAYGDETGVSVELTVSDRALVPELQKRIEKELRAAERWRASDYGPY